MAVIVASIGKGKYHHWPGTTGLYMLAYVQLGSGSVVTVSTKTTGAITSGIGGIKLVVYTILAVPTKGFSDSCRKNLF